MVIVTRYHKNNSRFYELKVVYRYLPKEVGEHIRRFNELGGVEHTLDPASHFHKKPSTTGQTRRGNLKTLLPRQAPSKSWA